MIIFFEIVPDRSAYISLMIFVGGINNFHSVRLVCWWLAGVQILDVIDHN